MSEITRNRRGSALKVPAQEEDPIERKRVLNILAQRRYRQRKKEQLRKLEQQLENGMRANSICIVEDLSPDQVSASVQLSVPTANDEVDLISNNESNNYGSENPSVVENTSSSAQARQAWNPSVFFPLADLPSTPMSEAGSPASSLTDLTRTTSTSATTPSVGADERDLPVFNLTLLRAISTTASRLGMEERSWELDAMSPFYHAEQQKNATIDFSHLPAHLKPTHVQQTFPHHPILDILPWPKTRNRLILILSQPPETRPPAAASPTALLDFVYEMEDSANGIKVWGEDPCAAEGWEVGQKLFTKWWWIFDRDILTNTNQLRRLRGVPPIQAGETRVVEELF